eukprot:s481_g5.t1
MLNLPARAGAKSVLNQSAVMTSSAAATLGALAPKAAPKAVPKDSSSAAEGSTATPSAVKVKSKPKAGQSVISGLNTSSSASAVLGPMVQAKK